MSKYLNDILKLVGFEYQIIEAKSFDNNPLIEGISFNSKLTKSGDLFVCIIGDNFDAHEFAQDAINAGAKAILAQKPVKDLSVPVILVKNTAEAMAIFSQCFFDYPGSKLRLLGVTGTNGKTTVTHLVQKIMENNNKDCGLIGTLGYRYSSQEKYRESKHTTPQAPVLLGYINDMAVKNFDYVVMEVSSHALDLHRVLGCDFAVALLTNITQDHLDFHCTMDNYANAKMKLFKSLADSKVENKYAIINIDDTYAAKFLDIVPQTVKKITYGLNKNADVMASNIQYSQEGTCFDCKSLYGNFEVNLKLKGQFSVYNALSAISIALVENVPIDVIVKTLFEVENVSGRFEAVSTRPLVIVDYAHTPDGLSNILATARKLVPDGGKLITVFGCGGDRDPTKRPKMGKITEQLSDKIIVTSDNPRTEDPQQIITDILTGIQSLDSEHVKVEINRAQAIEMAIKEAGEDDVVIIAGKGHEDYQILADKTIHFDDREVVREVISKLNSFKVGGKNGI